MSNRIPPTIKVTGVHAKIFNELSKERKKKMKKKALLKTVSDIVSTLGISLIGIAIGAAILYLFAAIPYGLLSLFGAWERIASSTVDIFYIYLVELLIIVGIFETRALYKSNLEDLEVEALNDSEDALNCE